ncbi:hypothetical protein LPJ60_002385 [Coemansia sp. RSA 2675]|nr:hypothetical protein LPJ60_002385 [Coemansia sp. RSA 2675]
MATEKCTLIPEQLFDSQDAFISHVKHFALENGFNVRLDDVERDKGGSIRKRDIVCSSEGAPRGKEASGKREDSVGRSDVDDSEPMTPKTGGLAHSGAHRRKSMKTGCRWLARASRQSSGMWKMIMLRLEHNHPLTTRYELFQPAALVRTGDDASIGHATSAARAALLGGTYRGPSPEFKNLFLQMSTACTDLCWAAARHPETVTEVLSEIRRLIQHLDKHAEQEDYDMRARSALPASDNDDAAEPDAGDRPPGDSSLVMMGHSISDMINHRIAAQPQPAHFLGAPHMDAAPPQLLARAQSRHAAEAQSPELLSTGAALSPPAPPAAPPAQSAAGPVKRARGRPRKNPVGGEGRAAKAKAQKRDQTQQAPAPPAQPTPTPADLASLTHQIISQNAASPASVQRSIGASLALPPQPMQIHAHHSRAPMVGAGNAPPTGDARSHAAQRQGPVPQPQQSPTFFLGAAEGIGYPEHAAAAAAAANVEHAAAAAAAAEPNPNGPEAVGPAALYNHQKPSRPGWDPAAATAAAAFPQYPAAAYPAYAPPAANVVRGGLPSPAAVPAVPPAAATPVPRSAAISAISDPATNAPAPVDAPDAPAYWPPSSARPRAAADRDSSRLAKARLVSKAMAIDPGASSAESPHLSTVNPIAPAFPSYSSYQQQQQQSYYNYQQQRMEQQYHAEQPAEAVGAGSPPVSAISQLVISSTSAVPGATGYSQSALVGTAPNAKAGQRATAQASHQYQQYQQSHLLHHQQHQSQAQLIQMNRDQAAQINPYWILPRAQQQKQPQPDHLASASAQQQPAAVLSSLPPMAHGGDVLPGAGRRLDELQLNQYQGMNSWQM